MRGLIVMHHSASVITAADSGTMAKDPICGMMVSKATALASERNGRLYYFCSPACTTRPMAAFTLGEHW